MEREKFDRVLGAAAILDDYGILADVVRTQAADEHKSDGTVVAESLLRQLARLMLNGAIPGFLPDLSRVIAMLDEGSDEERRCICQLLKMVWQYIYAIERGEVDVDDSAVTVH